MQRMTRSTCVRVYRMPLARQTVFSIVMCAVVCGWSPRADAQLKHEVRVAAENVAPGFGGSELLRFNSRLELMGVTSAKGLGGKIGQATPIALDTTGRTTVAFDPLNTTQLLRIDNSSVVQPSAWLAHNPVNVVVSEDGRAFATTRIGLSAPGPAYGVGADGTVLWANASGPSIYNLGYPQQLVMTGAGELWVGDSWVPTPSAKGLPLMVLLSKDTGQILSRLVLPSNSTLHVGICGFLPSGDGGVWAFTCAGPDRALHKVVGKTVVNSFPVQAGYNSSSYHMHVDVLDRPHLVSLNNEAGGWGTRILRYNPADPATPDKVYQLGGGIVGWNFGASGEELFAVVGPLDAPLTRRLERLNLVTGVSSSIPLDPTWKSGTMSYGDTTGFRYANVIDRHGDNDGDGAANSVETTAGSSPYDASSRPEGPKVYLSFTPGNSIVLTYKDPDGLLDPVGGLDLSTLSLHIGGGSNNVFPLLLQFLTAVSVSPDGKQAMATFGALPLPANVGLRLEPSVHDLTGAKGWDWQVSPPGKL